LSAKGLKEKQGIEYEEQCAGTDSCGLNTPSRERRRFQYADIDDEGVVAQRPYSGQANDAVNVAWVSVIAAALGNQLIPRRICRHLVIAGICRIGVTYDEGAVPVH
jgi:hypothetical protein